MRGYIYDNVERGFVDCEVRLLDGVARQGDYVLFEDGTISFCFGTELNGGELYLMLFDVGCVGDAEADADDSTVGEPNCSTFCVPAFDARPCAVLLDRGEIFAPR